MWFYFLKSGTEIRIGVKAPALEYGYNYDRHTHLIIFDGGNLALTESEFQQLKEILKVKK